MSFHAISRSRRSALIFALVAAFAAATPMGAAFAADPAPAAAPAPAADAAAPASVQPAHDVTAPAAPTATVDNPYGLDALWAQGDVVARGTLLILVIMSISTWYIMVLKLFEQTRLLLRGKAANKTFWHAKSPVEGLKTLPADSPQRNALYAAMVE